MNADYYINILFLDDKLNVEVAMYILKTIHLKRTEISTICKGDVYNDEK